MYPDACGVAGGHEHPRKANPFIAGIYLPACFRGRTVGKKNNQEEGIRNAYTILLFLKTGVHRGRKGKKKKKREENGIWGHTHKYDFASWGKRGWLGGVRLRHGLLQRELIASLDVARGEELCNVHFEHQDGICGGAVDNSHFRIFGTGLVWVGAECRAGGVTRDGNQGEMTGSSKVDGYGTISILYSIAAAQRIQKKVLGQLDEVQTLQIATHSAAFPQAVLV